MTDDEIRVKIAEVWGFEPGTINQTSWLGYCDPRRAETLYQLGCDVEDSDEKPNHILAKVPYFPGDLNAMHEAEKVLTAEQAETYFTKIMFWPGGVTEPHWRHDPHSAYGNTLCSHTAHATARQRAEAFIATVCS